MWSLKKQASHSMPMPMPMSLRSAVPEMHLLMLRRPPLVYDIRRYSSPIPSPSSRKASHRDVRRESVSSTARSLGPRCAYSYYLGTPTTPSHHGGHGARSYYCSTVQRTFQATVPRPLYRYSSSATVGTCGTYRYMYR